MSEPATPLFFYGSLRDEAVLRGVLGAAAPGVRLTPAAVAGRRAVCAGGIAAGVYPVAVAAPGRRLEGVLAHGLDAAAVERLTAYEGAEYRLGAVDALTDGGPASARLFEPVAEPGAAHGDEAGDEAQARNWEFEAWRAAEAPATRAAAQALGRMFDAEAARAGGRADPALLRALAELWPELLGEARRALGLDGPVRRRLGAGFDRAAVAETERSRPYEAYFKVDRVRLRHRLLGREEAFGAEIERAVFRSGDAVVVLPYDPIRDRVLLIEQFRPGPWLSEDERPWLIEAVAGRVEAETRAGEADPEAATARKEAAEEAGLALGRLERMLRGYASPGATDETLAFFVGEARLADGPGAEGVFGLEEEGEDIRVFTLSLDEALEALAAGEIRNAPAGLALLWLARHRARLRAVWASPGPLD